MYKSLAVTNLRCLTDFKIEPLQRINLIAGRNNVGKTTLLEALWFHNGPNVPDLVHRANRFRGLSEIDLNQPFWELFSGFTPDLKIGLSGWGDWGEKERTLHIYLEDRKVVQTPVSEQAGSEVGSVEKSTIPVKAARYQIVFEYTDENDKVFKSWGQALERQVTPAVVELAILSHQEQTGSRGAGIYLPARHRVTGKEDVERFSNIELAQRQEEILNTLKLIEPRIKRLSLIVRGGAPILHADIGTGRLVPVALLGDGMSRILSVALAIGNAPEGVVLIDEIENGIYHGSMTAVWKALAALARQFDVQIFATTHSHECIVAAYEAFSGSDPFDFRLHRLEHRDDTVRAVTYDKDTLGVALESGLELR